jgi:hypothetical protein
MPLATAASEKDVRASYRDGILEVRMPIDQKEARAKKIAIQRGSPRLRQDRPESWRPSMNRVLADRREAGRVRRNVSPTAGRRRRALDEANGTPSELPRTASFEALVGHPLGVPHDQRMPQRSGGQLATWSLPPSRPRARRGVTQASIGSEGPRDRLAVMNGIERPPDPFPPETDPGATDAAASADSPPVPTPPSSPTRVV